MIHQNKNSAYWILIILLVSSQFIPSFGAIDKLGPQFLYLSIICFVSSVVLFYRKYFLKNEIFYKEKALFIFLGLVLWSLCSVLWAFNQVEATITFFKLFVIFLLLFNLNVYFNILRITYKQVSYIVSFLLVPDLIFILLQFYVLYDFEIPPSRNILFQGFAGNLNVTGFSLLFRLPFIMYLFFESKNIYSRLTYNLLIISSVFCIFLSGSRGSILFLTFVLIFIIFYALFYHRLIIRSTVILISTCALTFLLHGYLFQNGNTVIKRVSTVSPTKIRFDDSSIERVNWYLSAIEGITERPLLGWGIGNWKIIGTKYVTQKIEQYIVPKHVHNDFLQMFTELGIVGGTLFLSLFAVSLVVIFRKLKLLNEWKDIFPFVLCSLIAYVGDSLLNFPFERPIAITNFILLIAFINSEIKSSVLKSKYDFLISIFIFLGGILSVYSSFLVYSGMVDEVYFKDTVNHKNNFTTPLEEIKKLNDKYPNINATTIPIVTLKALHYWKNGEVEKSKNMLHEGNKINPFLSISEANLASIFLEEKKLDSAYIYAKKAFYGLPENERHTNIYQMVIGEKGDLNELNSIFEMKRDKKQLFTYRNHLLILRQLKSFDTFNEKDREIASEAVGLFPNDESIKRSYLLIVKGMKLIEEANTLDAEANSFFAQKKYDLAIEKWKLAKAILPIESSYYLNMAQSLSINGQIAASNAVLDSIKLLKIYKGDGQWEFLRAINDLSKNQKGMACQNLLIAYRLGKVNETLPLIRQLKCSTR